MRSPDVVAERRARWGLTRYVAAATLARTADGGAVVAIVLLVVESGAPGWVAGLLAASITAPHLLGPFIARRLDTARDGRTVIALACIVHGVTLAAAVLAYPSVSTAVTAALLFTSGLVGPFLTGGISSRLPGIVGPELRSQRRAQGWDVATYGLGGTVGPAVVAVVATAADATAAALVLAGGTLVAAAFIRLLPATPPAADSRDVPSPFRTLTTIASSGALRRTLILTIVVAASVAALPIVAVASATGFGAAAATAGTLTAAYGIGSLAGSVGVMIRPGTRDADIMTSRLTLGVAAALAAVLLAPNIWLAFASYGAAGVANAYFFAATLAARSEYAPAAARGQVFVWVGALKITAGSAGTALAGASVAHGVTLPILIGLMATVAAAAACLMDRRRERLG